MFGILIVSAFFSLPTFASNQFVVKYDDDAANGRCLPQSTEEPEKVFQRNNIRVSGDVQVAEAQALAQVISAIEVIGDGKFSAQRNARFRFGTVWGPSRYKDGIIQINPGRQNVREMDDRRYGGRNNRAMLTHELGHYIGHQGFYQDYFKAVPKRNGVGCLISGYAAKKRNEEWAEVFAAFVTNQSLFSGKGSQCAEALSFLKGIFGEVENVTSSCGH